MNSLSTRGFRRRFAGPFAAPKQRSGLAAVALMLSIALLAGCQDSADTTRQPGQADGASASAPVKDEMALPPAPLARFVKLVELTEWSSEPWAAVAEFNLIDATGATLERKTWVVKADSADANDPASNAIDGNPKTHWHTRWQGADPPPPHELVVDLGAATKITGFRYLPRQDGTPNGTIAQYRFYVSLDGVNWGDPVSSGDFSLSRMGPQALEKTVVFAEQTANHAPVVKAPAAQSTPQGQTVSLQIAASDAEADPLSYAAVGLPPGISMFPGTGLMSGTPISPGLYPVKVSVKDNKGATASVEFPWTVLGSVASADGAKPAPGEVRFVKLEELTEASGKAWGSIAEFNLIDAKGNNLPRAGWLASADSADVSDTPANAIDGNPASIWHSQWNGASPVPPHSFIVDMRRFSAVQGFRYLPRQDRLTNGMLGKFRFYVSIDGIDWGKAVAEGDFAQMGAPNAEKTVHIK